VPSHPRSASERCANVLLLLEKDRGVMVRIAITVEAFEVIARTMPLGSFGFERDPNEQERRTVWLEEVWVNRLGAARFRPPVGSSTHCV
jgi:hypothetical protein